jgi:DNA-binding response OmpR family regulator
MTRVLLVDDARLLAELEGTALDRDVFEVRVAGVHTDLARAVRDLQPRVVVLGEGESCPDALEICRRIRQDPATRAVSIIYIGMGLNRERSRQAGADVFIPRPFTRLELREAFHRVLRLRDRIAVRRAVELPVELILADAPLAVVCRDLSLSGAFVETDEQLEPGQRATLRFAAGSRQIQVPVEIVRRGSGHSGEAGVGVQFVGLDADTGAYLSRFVRSVGDRRGGHPGPPPAKAST